MLLLRILFLLSALILNIYTTYSQDIVKGEEEEGIQFIKQRGYSLEACYRMAEDYLRSNGNQRRAIPYLEYIIEANKDCDLKVLFMLAQSYYYNGQFDLAIKVISEYIEKEKNGKLKKVGKDELHKFENALSLASSPGNVELINLGPKINTKYAEVNPYVSVYENLLVYSSKRFKDYDVYVSKKRPYDSYWSKSKLAGKFVNTINDEFVAGLSSSGQNLFVHYNQVSGFEDINMSHRTKGLYRELEDPGSKINSTYREEGACISKMKDTLYFASDRPEGYGGFDIYYSLKLPEGDWGPPINMGKTVNTEFDENYPNLSPDGSKLYFASKGHNSIGGFDIFYTTFNKDAGIWNDPVNLGYPINNAFDNKNIAFTETDRYAYISTVDKKSYGDFDIYKVIFHDVPADYLIVRAEVLAKDSIEYKPFNSEDEDLVLTIFSGDETYGIYSFDKRNNCFVLALVPGVYTLEIDSKNYSPYKKQVTINENYYRTKRRSLKIHLEKLHN